MIALQGCSVIVRFLARLTIAGSLLYYGLAGLIVLPSKMTAGSTEAVLLSTPYIAICCLIVLGWFGWARLARWSFTAQSDGSADVMGLSLILAGVALATVAGFVGALLAGSLDGVYGLIGLQRLADEGFAAIAVSTAAGVLVLASIGLQRQMKVGYIGAIAGLCILGFVAANLTTIDDGLLAQPLIAFIVAQFYLIATSPVRGLFWGREVNQ